MLQGTSVYNFCKKINLVTERFNAEDFCLDAGFVYKQDLYLMHLHIPRGFMGVCLFTAFVTVDQ